MRIKFKITPSQVEFDVWLLFVRKGSDERPMFTDEMWENLADKLSEELWGVSYWTVAYNDNPHLTLERSITETEQVCTLCDRPHDDTWNPNHAFAGEECDKFEYLSVKYEEDLDEWKATLPAEIVTAIDGFNEHSLELKLL